MLDVKVLIYNQHYLIGLANIMVPDQWFDMIQ